MIREGLEEAGCELRPENDEQAIRVAFQRETVVETQAWSGRGLSLLKGRVREWKKRWRRRGEEKETEIWAGRSWMVWLLPSGLSPLAQSPGAGCLSLVSLATSWTTQASLHGITNVAKEIKARHSPVFHASGSWLTMSLCPLGQQSRPTLESTGRLLKGVVQRGVLTRAVCPQF